MADEDYLMSQFGYGLSDHFKRALWLTNENECSIRYLPRMFWCDFINGFVKIPSVPNDLDFDSLAVACLTTAGCELVKILFTAQTFYYKSMVYMAPIPDS